MVGKLIFSVHSINTMASCIQMILFFVCWYAFDLEVFSYMQSYRSYIICLGICCMICCMLLMFIMGRSCKKTVLMLSFNLMSGCYVVFLLIIFYFADDHSSLQYLAICSLANLMSNTMLWFHFDHNISTSMDYDLFHFLYVVYCWGFVFTCIHYHDELMFMMMNISS